MEKFFFSCGISRVEGSERMKGRVSHVMIRETEGEVARSPDGGVPTSDFTLSLSAVYLTHSKLIYITVDQRRGGLI